MLQRRVREADLETGFRFTPKQEKARDMLISDAVHCAVGGGGRSGKTFLILRQVLVRAVKAPGSRHAVFRFRFNSLKASLIYDTLPKVLKLCFPSLPPMSEMMNKTDWFLTLPNGSEIWFGGLDDKERTEKILGMEFATLYFNECSQIPWASIVLAQSRLAQKVEGLRLKAYYDFNPPSKMHWTYLLFVKRVNPIDKVPMPKPMRYGFYIINPKDNLDNISEEYIEILEAMPEVARNRFLHGRFADDSDGALWTVETLAQNRRLGHQNEKPLPPWSRVIISVDPSGCEGPEDYRSDEIGIMAGALGTDGHGYLLEDLSLRGKPEVWGRVVAEAYKRLNADLVVGEKNFGGDMVRSTIHAHNPLIPYKHVTASRGKIVRAQPISSLDDQGKLHHVGHFPELEDQMCSTLASGYIGLKSPDRMDSRVWLFTEMFPGLVEPTAQRNWRPPAVKSGKRSAARYSRVN